MAGNYMPSGDSQFEDWASNFATYVVANALELGIQPLVAADIESGVNLYRTSLEGHITTQDLAHAARQVKDERKQLSEDAIRRLVRQLQASPQVTDEQRQAMGITVRGQRLVSMAAVIESRPIGKVDTSKRLHHSIRYWDDAAGNKARPDFAKGCEVWVAITPAGTSAPVEMSAYRNLGTNSASPFMIDFAMEDGGKMAHYMLRWVGTEDEKGTWSEVISATIVG
jgi:hypothetical protein